MRENTIKTIWNRGDCVLNGWLSIPNSFTAEMMANAGWDSICIDTQHGLIGYETAVHMLQAISTTPVTPIIRVVWNEPGTIMKWLDAGAYGIVCPMVNTRADAERFVEACRYPPAGYRSSGPIRAAIYGGKDHREKANETVVTFANEAYFQWLELTLAFAILITLLSFKKLRLSENGLYLASICTVLGCITNRFNVCF